MGYKFRKVICPYCQNEFMWQIGVQSGSAWTEYENVVTKEECLSAICTKCSRKMIVSKFEKTGICIDSKDFITSNYRGI